MTKKYITIAVAVISTLCLIGLFIFFAIEWKMAYEKQSRINAESTSTASHQSQKDKEATIEKPEETKPVQKSPEEKQKVMEADGPTMDALGLRYDYANLDLTQVVQAYLAEAGIEQSQIAFSYKDLTTGQTFAMNDTQPMTAGSTYKLPLNMLVVDEVAEGKLSMEERFDITQTHFEYQGEHDNYVAAFNGAMSIPDMQEYSLVYSENTPAYALAERLGGMDKAYEITTDYYIQVLEYLSKNQEKYKDILYYIGESFPGEYYKRYLRDITIYQKPGYVREALNVDALVMEEKPYIVALYTAYLGGSTESSDEISGLGIEQVGQLAYVINEWHRVNKN